LGAAGTLSAQERELAEVAETTGGKELEATIFAARAAEYDVQAARAALLAPGGDEAALVATCAHGTESCLELRSPIVGRVLRILQESERVVTAGEPLVELGDPSQMEIVVDVLSTDAVKVRPGAPVLLEDWGGEGTLQARVRLVEPSGFTKVSALGVEEQRVNVIVDFVDVPAFLGDAFRLEARIVVWEAAAILTIPSSALFRRGATWNVFVADGGKARYREIQIGHRNTHDVEIVRGLDEGEPVILHPSDQVGDGVRVKFQ
jgi:HlyD family secretion protein